VKLARGKKAALDQERLEEKERLTAEARFDRLLSLFDKVRIEEPPLAPAAPKAVRKKREPEEPEPEELEKPKAKAIAKPATKEVFLRFY